jgi:hypothetical protein
LPPNPMAQGTSSGGSPGSGPEQAKAGANDAVDDKDPLRLADEEWEFDGDGALWPKTNEPVNPDLSIGIISK